MAAISSIRKHAGLIVTIIGVALLAFIAGDFKGQLFSPSGQTAGEISGNKISLMDFENEVQRISNIQKERTRKAALDEQTMSDIRDGVWENFINELVLKPQFENAGIAVSDEEVKELILGNDPDPMVINYFTDHNSNQLYPYFQDAATGKLKASSVKIYVDSLPPSEKSRWSKFEDNLREERIQKKYLSLVKMGMYITTAQAKQDYAELNRVVDFKYISKPYSGIPDSSVQINEQDLLKYYNENQYKYKQDASRKLEYVIFDIKPSQTDYDEVKKQMEKIADDWKQINTFKEDSLLVIRESDNRYLDTTYYAKGHFSPIIDSLVSVSDKGTILPLYLDNGQYKLSKVLDWKMLPDSVKARHILLSFNPQDTLAKERTKIKIDSLLNVVKIKHNFDTLAKMFSQDKGSAKDGGDLGWFTAGRMVPEFDYFCFNGKKGDLRVVLTKFGYHLIEITDQSPLVRKTELATINRSIEPSLKTRQDVYNKCIDFIAKYHTSETFEKGVEEMHLIKRLADPLKENDKSIAGIENPRELIRWAFSADKGAVSTEPFSSHNKYVVAHLAEIRKKGIAPMEQKKDEVAKGARKAKKAEKIIQNMLSLHATTVADYASKLNLQANTTEGATFSSYVIPNIGRELDLYGPLFSLKQNETSKPIAGESGVFVLQIEKITEPAATNDYSDAKAQVKNNFIYRIDNEAIDAIKKHADIVDDRAKYF